MQCNQMQSESAAQQLDKCLKMFHSFHFNVDSRVLVKTIYLYINLYSAPSRQLLRGAPSPGSAKQESLEEFIKRTGKVMQERTKFRGKIIPNRGTHNRESPFLSGGSASTWHQKVPLGGRAERSATRAGRRQVEELQKIRRFTLTYLPLFPSIFKMFIFQYLINYNVYIH